MKSRSGNSLLKWKKARMTDRGRANGGEGKKKGDRFADDLSGFLTLKEKYCNWIKAGSCHYVFKCLCISLYARHQRLAELFPLIQQLFLFVAL